MRRLSFVFPLSCRCLKIEGVLSVKSYCNWYHPISRLMKILHFHWLRYQDYYHSPLKAKFADVSFVLFLNKYFFNLHLLTLLLNVLSDQLDDTKTIRPFALKGHGPISPFGFAARATGLTVNYKVLEQFLFECGKVISFALLRYMIGLQNSRHFFIQSQVK